MEYLILCGGYGTRFQKVSKTIPKILVEIKNGISMLDWLIEEYIPENSKIILASGHLHEKIYEYVDLKKYRSKLTFSREKNKMGTGGAIIKASSLIQSEEFIVLNGDTIQEVKISDFLEKSKLENGVVINIGCSKANYEDSGNLVINQDNLIVNFSEKKNPELFIGKDLKLCSSLGMYRCNTKFFQTIKKSCLSLEDELLPQLVIEKKASASIFNHKYYDFGTLDRYQKFIGNNL